MRRSFISGPRLLWIGMWLLLSAYCLALLLHGKHYEPLVDGWLSTLVDIPPALLAWLAVEKAGVRRREVMLLASSLTLFALADVVFNIQAANNPNPPFPSIADIGYLAFYPLILSALALGIRRDLRGTQVAVWMDTALGGLGAACALAVLLAPVFRHATGGWLAQAVSIAYPVMDILLIATVVGVMALRGWRLGSSWVWPILGLFVFTAADVIYALRVAHDAYAEGSILDALWPIGLALLACWALSPASSNERPVRISVLAVSALATLLSVVVLVVATQLPLGRMAVAFAAATLLAAGARTQAAFRQVARVADLRRQATTDDLTGLPNRRALYASVTAALSDSTRQRALLLLDLDRFKEVNDILGHHVGDELLVQAARRLRESLREQDVLARLGGDEFAVLLESADEERAVAVAMKLRAAVATPFALEDITMHTGVSIGIALFPHHGTDIATLLRRADMAMYKAKNARDGHRLYTTTDDSRGSERLRTLQELRTALEEDQLILHFQPKIDPRNGQVRGVEALVRWDHPTRGLLYPDSFLDIIEDSGLMQAMTRLVLARALDQARDWRDRGWAVTVAVNLSASSLLDERLPDHIEAELTARGLAPDVLQLEITEETLMSDRRRARRILTRLRELGVQIAVDDFGTGYSSLSYLRELPIDELKLDRSFVFPMADDARAGALVESTISLAHSLGLRMVAEGVEDDNTYTELSRYGCDQVQGFYVSRPVPAAELDHWLERRDQELPVGSSG